MTKNETRLRRAKSTRSRIKNLGVARLSVHRTDQHIYAQVIDASGGKVIAAASTVQKAIKDGLKGTKNKTAAAAVGKAIAEKAKAKGIAEAAFDRGQFRFHGRVQALARAATDNGLKCTGPAPAPKQPKAPPPDAKKVGGKKEKKEKKAEATA